MSPDLFFENKKYISTKAAASLSGYSNDYVGQLCRGGRIDSKRIGRVWYVSEESILNHKKNFVSESSRLAEICPTTTEKSISDRRERAETSLNKPLGLGETISQRSWLFLNNPVPTGLVFIITATILILSFVITSGASFSRVSDQIASLPRSIYGALDDVTKLYSTGLEQGYVTVGRVIIDESSHLEEKMVGVLKNPPLYIVESIKSISQKESKLVDTGALGSAHLVLDTHQKVFSFISNSVSGITDAKRNLKETGGLMANVVSSLNSFDKAGVLVYQEVNGWFDRFVYSPMSKFFATPQTVMPTLVINKNVSTSISPAKVVNTTNVIEKTIERTTQPDITKVEVDAKLQELNNKLMSEFSKLSTGSGGAVTNIYREIAQSQVVGNLSGTTISNPTIIGGSISGTSVNATSLIVTGSATSTFANGIDIASGCFSVNGVCLGGGTGSMDVGAVNSYIDASTTIPKLYTANIFTEADTFNGTLTFGSLDGPLQANNGIVSATTSVGVLYGGTGLAMAPEYGQLLLGNSSGGYDLVATSSLGIVGTGGIQSLNGLSSADQTFSTSAAGGLDFTVTSSGSDHLFSLSPSVGYSVPLSASTTEWSNFYTTPSNRISAGLNLSWNGNTLNLSTTTLNLTTSAFASDNISQWTNNAGYITGINQLGMIGDVSTSSLAYGHLLLWNGTKWQDTATSSLGITSAVWGNITGALSSQTDLQNALNNKVSSTTVINTTYPLLGGGDLTTSRTLSLGFGTTTNNTWAGLQTFSNASSTFFSSSYASSTNGYFGTLSLGGTDLQSTLNGKQNSITVSWPITLSGVDLGFNGLSTSTSVVVGNIPYFSGVNTFANIATSSLAINGSLSSSGTLGYQIGGSNTTLSLNMANGNHWTANQIFDFSSTTYGTFTTASTTNLTIGGNTFSSLLGSGLLNTSNALTLDTTFLNTTANSYINSSTTIPKTYTANTFTALQTFNYSSSTIYSSFATASSTNAYLGTLTLGTGLNGPLQANAGVVSATTSVGVLYGGTGLTTAPSYGSILVGNSTGGYVLTATSSLGLPTFAFPFAVNSGYNSTSTVMGFTGGLFSTASSTFSSSLYLPSLSQGFSYLGSNGLVQTTSTSSLANYILPFTSYGASTSTVVGFTGGLFSTASSTFSSALRLTSLSQGADYIGSGGLLNTVSTSTITAGSSLSYTGGTFGSELGGTSGTLSLNMANGNHWTANQIFDFSSTTYGTFTTASTTNLTIGGNTFSSLLGSGLLNTSNALTLDTTFLNTTANSYINSSTTIPKTYTANTFTALQTFNYSSSTIYSSFATASSTNAYLGTLTLGTGLNGPLQANAGVVSATTSVGVLYGGTGLTTAPSYGSILVGNSTGGYVLTATSSLGLPTFAFPFAVNSGYNSTSTVMGFTGGLFSTASSTFSSSLYLPSLSQGFSYLGSNGLVQTTSTSSLANYILPFTSYGASTSTVVGFTGGLFSTASSTFSNTLAYTGTAINSLLSTNASGVITATSTPTFGAFNATSTNVNSTIAGGLVVGTDNLVVDYSTGYVGIGKLSPGVALDVSGSTSLLDNSSFYATSPILKLADSDRTFAATITGTNPGDTTNGLYIGTDSNHPIMMGTVGSEKMRITTTGSVGIGTTTPWGKFAINNLSTDTTRPLFTIASSTTSATTTLMTVLNNGYVGIGTQSPAGLLDVNSKLTVSNTGFGTTTLAGLNISGSATSTSNVGWNITAGCFAIGGNCIGTYGDSNVNSYINASTTIPKTYTANTFTALQTFNYSSSTIYSSFATASSTNAYLGTLTLGTGLNGPLQANAGVVSATTSVGVLYGGTGLTTAPSYGSILVGNSTGGYVLTATSSLGLPTFAFPFAVNSGYNSTSTVIGFNGLFSTASSTFSSSLYLPSLSQGFSYLGSNGLVQTTSTSSLANYILPFTSYGASTSTVVGFTGGLFSTASSTFSSALRLTSLSQGADYIGSGGLLNTVSTSTITAGSSLSYTGGTFGSELGGTSGTLSLNMANGNHWTANQIFDFSSTTYGTFTTASTTNLTIGGNTFSSLLGSGLLNTSNALTLDTTFLNTTANSYINSSTTIPKTYTANTFTALQTFNYSSSTIYSSFATASSTNAYLGTLTLGTGLNGPLQANAGVVSATTSVGVLYGGTGLTTAPSYGSILVGNSTGGYVLTATSSLGLPTFAFPFAVNSGYNSTSTVMGFTGGLFSTASSTFSSSLYLPSLSQGFSYLGSNGLVQTTSTSSLANYILPFTSYGASTSTVVGFTGGLFSTASSTFSSALRLTSLSQGADYIGSGGLLNTVSTSTITAGSSLSYTGGTFGSELGGTSGTLSLNMANGNHWTANQIFDFSSTTYGTFTTASTTNLTIGGNTFSSLLGSGLLNTSNALTLDTTFLNTTANSYINSSTTIPKTYTANTFTALQTFNYSSSTIYSSFATASSTNAYLGTLTLGTGLNGPLQANAGVVSATTSVGVLYGGTGLTTAPSYGSILVGNSTGGYVLTATSSLGLPTFAFPFAVNSGYNSTSTVMGFTGGLFSTASSTFSSSLYLPSLSQGFSYLGSNGLVQTTSTSSLANYILPFTSYGASTSTVVGFTGGLFSTASSTFSNTLAYTGTAINSLLSTNASGVITATSTPTFGAFNATSTTATSTISTGGLAVGTNQLVVQQNSGSIGIGTTTPQWLLNPFSSTAPQLSLSAGAGLAQWTLRNAGGNFYLSTTTVAGTATTSTSALTVSGTGFGTTTVLGLNISGQATSTSNVGWNITAGCFAVNGTCIGTYGDSNVNSYINASTTIPKTYTANTFTALQTFNYSSSTIYSSFATASSTNAYLGTLTLGTGLNGPLQANAGVVSATTSVGVLYGGTGLTTAPSYGSILVGNSTGGYVLTATSSLGLPTFAFPFAVNSGYNSTSTVMGFTGGLFSTASSTFSSSLYLPSLSQGFSYLGSNGLVQTTSTSSLANYILPFTSYGASTSTVVGFTGGLFSTASSTFSSALRLTSLSQGADYIGSGGLLNTVSTSTITAGSSLSYTGGTFGSELGGTSGTLSLNMANGNHWTANQIFDFSSTTYGTFTTASTTNLTIGGNTFSSLLGSGLLNTSNALTLDTTFLNTTANSYINSSTTIPKTYTANTFSGTNTFNGSVTLGGTVAINSLLSTNASGVITATSTPTFGNFNATSTTATSTIAGGLAVGASNLIVDRSTGFVGIGTASPGYKLDVAGGAHFQSQLITGGGGYDGYLQLAASGGNTTAQIQANGSSYFNGGNVGVGTTTPQYTLSSYSATAPQLSLSAGAGIAQWAFRNAGGNFYLSTTTIAGTATTSTSALTVSGTGFGTTTVLGLNITGQATSTSNVGFNITAGCFAIGGTCLGGGSASLTGTIGQVAYFSGTNTAVGTSTLYISTAGNVGIGSTAPIAPLHVEDSTTASGANAIAGIFASTTLTNSTASGFQFGNRFLNTVNGTVAGTMDGTIIRMTDNTSLANTVRGLEVQAYSGTNNFGTNTGITTFGKTFGLQAYTTGLAAGVYVPAAVYAELGNQTVGNAIRAYSGTSTSATLVSVSQDTSVFTGIGLSMDLGEGTGSFNSGYFMRLINAGADKFVITNTGSLGIGTTTPGSILSIGTGTDYINISNTATSTFSKGINITSGCFAINGTCVGGSTGTGITSLNGLSTPTQVFATTSVDGGFGFTSSVSTHTLNIPTAKASNPLGLLSGTDWTTFNNKQNVLGFTPMSNSLAKGNFIVGNDAGVAQATTSMFISSTGWLGIGTTTPTSKLTLQANDLTTSLFSIASSTGAPMLTVSPFGAISQNISSPNAFNIQDGNGNNVFNIDTSSSNTDNGFDIYASAGQTSNLLNFLSSDGNTNYANFSYTGGFTQNIASSTAFNIQNGSGVSVLTVNTVNGNVGIGTTSPVAVLSVQGTNAAGNLGNVFTVQGARSTNGSGSQGISLIAGTSVGAGAWPPAKLILGGSDFNGGNVLLYGGSSDSNGTAGYTDIQGGPGVNNPGGNVYITGGAQTQGGSLYPGNVILGVTAAGTIRGNVGIGTTTPQYLLTVASSTAPQLSLSAGAGLGQVTFRNDGNNFYISTTTLAGTATTSISALEIALAGFGTTTVRGLNVIGQATSTSNVGFNITAGCFAIGGTCINGGGAYGDTNVNTYINASTTIPKTYTNNTFTGTNSFSGTLTYTGTAINSLLSTNASGVITATSTPTFGAFNATSTTATSTISTGGLAVGTNQLVVQQNSGSIGIGTTTPQWLLNPFSSTAPQLSLSAGAGLAQWTLRNAGGNFYLSTTTVAGTATTSTSALTVSGTGFGTTTVLGLNISGQATSTSNVGWNITAGCFAVNGTCIGTYGDSNVNSYINASTTIPKTYIANTFTALQTFNYSSSTIYSSFATASSTNAYLGTLTLGTGLNGPLQANAGVVSATTSVGVLYGGTGATSFSPNSIITSNAAGTALIATSSQLTVGSLLATSTLSNSIFLNNWIGMGTSTPQYLLTIASSTAPQLSLSAGAGIAQWTLRNAGGNFYLSTTTVAGTATTSTSALSILNNGNVTVGGGANNAFFDINPYPSTQQILEIASSTGASIFHIMATGNIGVGTSTPQYQLNIYSSTAPQLALSAGAGLAQWTMRNAGGNFYLSTTTVAGTATTTTSALTIQNNGQIRINNAIDDAAGTPLVVRSFTGGSDNALTIQNGDNSNYYSKFSIGSTGMGITTMQYGGSELPMTFDGNSYIFKTGTSYPSVETMRLSTSGYLGLGTTSPISKLHVEGSTTASGANAIAGIFASTTLTNSTGSGFQFGNRFLNIVNGTTAGTEDGTFIRMTDNTSLVNTVRGLEVQAYSGSNTSGINEGIVAYGKTFGVHAYTNGLAGAVSTPAAVFAELDHPTSGNAIRAYSATSTTATLLSIYQETSAYTGSALMMDLGNTGGSFNGGNFINLKKTGTSVFSVNNLGNLTVTLPASTNNFAVCHETNGAGLDMLKDCSGAPSADYQEIYPTDSDIAWGDVLMASSTTIITSNGDNLSVLTKVNNAYSTNIIGVAANPADSGDFNTIGYNLPSTTHQNPVALKGRVKVKVSTENGDIKVGDFLTSSATMPGYAMKATRSGQIIGQALENFSSTATSTTSSVLTFISIGWQNIGNQFVLGEDNGQLSGNVAGEGLSNTVSASFLINQKGSGNILQLQSSDTDRFMVATNGAVSLLAQTATSTDALFTVRNGSDEVFNINARGDIAMSGVIIVKDDNFAGSIATDASGLADINFTYDLGTGKPVVELTPESDSPVFAQVSSWKKDTSGNYTGFTIKTFGITGTPASAVVHYLVTGKRDGYNTNGQTVRVSNAPSSNSTITTTGTGDTSGSTTSSDTIGTVTTDTGTGTTTTITETTTTDTTASTTVTDSTTTTDTTITTDVVPITDTSNAAAVIDSGIIAPAPTDTSTITPATDTIPAQNSTTTN